MPARDYDAIVVGASFGGLAVARQLKGEVLLLDRNEVGSVQTSACGTPLWVPEALGVSGSVLQVHDRLEIRTPTRTVRYDLSAVPFCTFDYRAFCEGLLAQCRARFLRTSVTGIEDGTVVDHRGTVHRARDRGLLGLAARAGRRRRRRARAALLRARDPHRAAGRRPDLPARSPPDPAGPGLDLSRRPRQPDRPRILRGPVEAQARARPVPAEGSRHGARLLSRDLSSRTARSAPRWAGCSRSATRPGSACRSPRKASAPRSTSAASAAASSSGCSTGPCPSRPVSRHTSGSSSATAVAYRVLQLAQWMAAHTPTRWFAMLTQLAAMQPLLPRWWPRYGRFGRSGSSGVPAVT